MLRVLINKILHFFEVRRIDTKDRVVYLTFDDGPEPGINDFVLDQLAKHRFTATFFCRGDKAELYPDLLASIRQQGHSIGNHTYSHLSGIITSSSEYIEDVKKANALLNTNLFRPPRGFLRIRAFLYIVVILKMKIIHWSLSSNDYDLDAFDLDKSLNNLISNTRPGEVILFHSCQRHAEETKKLLPSYLIWLKEHGYQSLSL